MNAQRWREQLVAYIREQANPPDKFSHQARLYALASQLGEDMTYDDEVLFAAAWLHDLGVFVGHRPEELKALAAWDHIRYANEQAPRILAQCDFPAAKVPLVQEIIRTHMPSGEPTCPEGILLRDADILEQLGAVGILRTVSKVGRDTRFIRFGDALAVLKRNLADLPKALKLEAARKLAGPRVQTLTQFIAAAEVESAGLEW